MSFSANDIVPLSQARAKLSELADAVKGGAEKIITKNGESYVALIDDVAAGRVNDARGRLESIRQRRRAA
jgi:prevent-host-death family protein